MPRLQLYKQPATINWVVIPKLGVPIIMENQMEMNMENEMETGII